MLEIREERLRSAPMGAWVLPATLWAVLLPGAAVGIRNAASAGGVSMGQWVLTGVALAGIVATGIVTTVGALGTIRQAERDGDALVIRGPGVAVRAVRRRCRLEIREATSLRRRTLQLWVVGRLEAGGRFEEILLPLDDLRAVGQARDIADALGLRLSETRR